MTPMRLVLQAVAGGALASSAQANSATLEVTLPRIEAVPYYRPYLAAWVEDERTAEPVATVAVWYDTRLRDDLGVGFLRHLRTWWRATGEEMTLPADGISGPTRGPGTHEIALGGADGPMAGLPAGQYRLALEVAREDGGRDILRLPLDWTGEAAVVEATGQEELGQVRLTVTP
ncbi:DUF2271 domain-containing protein [Aquicoccus sp. SCR17]|nr:DUF2271 domain-containing protein [Carideicomes alvinocaridis]